MQAETHRDTAIQALAEREYRAAGDAYTRAGRAALADPREGLDPFAPDEKGWVGRGLQYLCLAAVAYRVAGLDSRATTPLFEAATTVVQQVARGSANGEIAVQWDDLHGPDPNDSGAYLAHRANCKARRFPSLVAKAVEGGYLAAPRGTTEYDNDDYRCPECGSTDVNWAGGTVLCMRCSTPVTRR